MSDFDSRKAIDDLRQELSILKTASAVMDKQIQEFEKALIERVQRLEFLPVKLIAYALAGGTLTTVLGAILSKVIMK